mmetsp:Transcript_33990/g.79503  ORF Transcript_33990/g.79503 Transcript_33990/m.79503 type:complete len:329 (+) Transcript_33990:40-1026(+)
MDHLANLQVRGRVALAFDVLSSMKVKGQQLALQTTEVTAFSPSRSSQAPAPATDEDIFRFRETRSFSLSSSAALSRMEYRATVEVPSTKRVRKSTLALLNMPSLSDTTMNCECGKCVRIMWPMFWVWLKSKAESISSRMYIGAGLNRRSASTSERARRDRWPPLSSDKDCFQTPLKATLISKPSTSLMPCGGSNLALVCGRSVLKMESKSLFTFCHVRRSVSVFLWSRSTMTSSIFFLSLRMMSRFSNKSLYSCSALSNIAIAFLLMFLLSFFCCDSMSLSLPFASSGLLAWKSKSVPFLPKRCFSFSSHGFSFSSLATTTWTSLSSF